MKKRVLRVKMGKGPQTLVMQGVVHIASLEFYEKIQKEMDQMVESGYKIFREAATGGAEPKNSTEQEVFDSINVWMLEVADLLAPMHGMVVQKRFLVYPESTIFADMNGNEFLAKAAKIGASPKNFHPKKMWENWQNLSVDQKREMVKRYAYKPNPWFVFRLILTKKFRKTMRLFLTERSRSAFDVISNTNFEKGYITYGNAHLKQVIKHLKKDGWTVLEKQHEST